MGNNISSENRSGSNSSNVVTNSIQTNKHFPILQEFHRGCGTYDSIQARAFIDKYIDQSISSESRLLSGKITTRSSRDDVHAAWMTAYQGKWRHEMINENQWTATTHGEIDTLFMSYKLIIPIKGKPTTPYVMYFHLCAQFNNVTGLWIRSAYTEYTTVASKVGSTISSAFEWYVNHTAGQLDTTLTEYEKIISSRASSSSSTPVSSSSNNQYQQNRNRQIQDQNNYANQINQQNAQREREYKQSLS